MSHDEHRCARMIDDYWEPVVPAQSRSDRAGVERRRSSPTQFSSGVPQRARQRPSLDLVRSTNTAGEEDLRIPLRHRRPRPAKPVRWPYLAIFPAVVAIVVLLIRLTTLNTPPPEPQIQPLDARPTIAIPSPEVAQAGPAAPATPAGVPSNVPSARPALPQFAQVTGTGGEGAQMRPQPSLTSRGGLIVPEGTLLEVTGNETSAENITWQPVKDAQGRSGWVSGQFLTMRPAAYAEARYSFWLRSDSRTSGKPVVETPAGTPLALIDSRAGEVLDQSEPQPSKWYWLRNLATGEVGWAYVGWVIRRD